MSNLFCQYREKFAVGFIGLVLMYALTTTNLLNTLLTSFVDCEKEFISVERIAEFIEHTPQEDNFFEKKVGF